MSQTIPAEFHGVHLSIIDHAGRRWLTAEQVGRALGYAETNASAGIRNLYNRHADEFTDTDTCRINLMRQGQMREVLVFSDTGCVLLGMFANTPRAKDFRIWAKTVLAGQVNAPMPATLDLAREIGTLRDELRAQSGMILDLYRKLDAARRGHIAAQRGQLAALREVAAVRNAQHAHAVQDGIDAVLRMEAEGMPRDEIARATGKTRNYIRQIVFRARNGRGGEHGPADPAGQGELALEG